MLYPRRVEGEKKVLGEPIFARDFLEYQGWGKTAFHALFDTGRVRRPGVPV